MSLPNRYFDLKKFYISIVGFKWYNQLRFCILLQRTLISSQLITYYTFDRRKMVLSVLGNVFYRLELVRRFDVKENRGITCIHSTVLLYKTVRWMQRFKNPVTNHRLWSSSDFLPFCSERHFGERRSLRFGFCVRFLNELVYCYCCSV